MQLSEGRIWRESGNLTEIFPIAEYICSTCKMYLSKLLNVLVQITKCISQIARNICPYREMYFGLPQLSQGRIWRESGNLSEIIPAQGPATDQAHLAAGLLPPIWVWVKMYLTKLQNVFALNCKMFCQYEFGSKYICPNCKIYFSKSQNVFV